MATAADALARLLCVAGRHADPALDAPLADYVTAKLRRATAGVAHTRRSGVGCAAVTAASGAGPGPERPDDAELPIT